MINAKFFNLKITKIELIMHKKYDYLSDVPDILNFVFYLFWFTSSLLSTSDWIGFVLFPLDWFPLELSDILSVCGSTLSFVSIFTLSKKKNSKYKYVHIPII